MGTTNSDETWTFAATIGRIGILYVADVPASVSRALGTAARVPVVAEVNGSEPLRTMLNPRGGGKHALYLNGTIRRQAGNAKEGSKVRITMRRDEAPLVREVPSDVAHALEEAGVRGAWDAIPRSNRNEILRWIDAAARPETRDKRIAKAVEKATLTHEKAVDRPVIRRAKIKNV